MIYTNIHLIIKINLISSFNFTNIQSASDNSFTSIFFIYTLNTLNICALSTTSCLFISVFTLYNLQQLILNSLLSFVRADWFNTLSIIIFAFIYNITDHFNSSVMYLFNKSSTFNKTAYYISINLFSELSINKKCFLKCFYFQNNTNMFFSVSLDNNESFLWFI